MRAELLQLAAEPLPQARAVSVLAMVGAGGEP